MNVIWLYTIISWAHARYILSHRLMRLILSRQLWIRIAKAYVQRVWCLRQTRLFRFETVFPKQKFTIRICHIINGDTMFALLTYLPSERRIALSTTIYGFNSVDLVVTHSKHKTNIYKLQVMNIHFFCSCWMGVLAPTLYMLDTRQQTTFFLISCLIEHRWRLNFKSELCREAGDANLH